MRASLLLVVIVGLFAANQALDLKEIGSNLVSSLVSKGKELLVSEYYVIRLHIIVLDFTRRFMYQLFLSGSQFNVN